MAAKRHDFEQHAKQYHQPREREDLESLTVFRRSAVAAGRDVKYHCEPTNYRTGKFFSEFNVLPVTLKDLPFSSE